MHLKRMEALGFKSFADKLQLDFTTGVTCIVGPNGCGKSNVCDAIKWVLGEQNARNIRSGGQGKTMQEVIFKGTNNRKPMSYCEVTLVFDNTDHAYDVDYEELIITRKLYRSGDSEYLINNKKSKLKDIINLFRDTGIGKDGYSVVGQGQIDAILSAKPEDRRQIFEEAAGISAYKANRKEALGRLDRALINVRTLDEQLRLMENIITPLKKEAEVAIKAKSLSERIRILDINHYLYVSDHSEEQREKLRERLKRENEELEKAIFERNETSKLYHETQEKLENLDAHYRELTQKKLKLSLEETERKKDGQHFSERLEEIDKDIARLTQEGIEKQKQIELNKSSLEGYTKSNDEKEREYLQAKTDEQSALDLYVNLSDTVSRKQTEIDLTNQALLNAADQSGAINADLAMLQAQKIALEENIARRNQEIEDHRSEIRKAEKEMLTLDEGIQQKKLGIDKKREELKGVELSYDQITDKLTNAEDQYRERIGTIAALKSKLNLLQQSRNSYANYDHAVKCLMTSNNSEIKSRVSGVIGDILKVISPKFATAIDIALGNNINNVVTETGEDAKFLINVLKQTGAGRATFLPLDLMHPRPLDAIYESVLDEDGCYGLAADLVRYDGKYRDAVETLLGKVVVVENADVGLAFARKYRNGFRMVTLDGENFGVSGALTGGSKGAGETHILSIENDIAEATKQLASLQKGYDVLTAEIEECKEQRKKLETADSVLRNMITKEQGDIEGLEKQKIYLDQSKARHDFDIEKLRTENNKDGQSLAEKDAQISVQKMKTTSETEKRSDSTDTLTMLANELGDLRRRLNDADNNRTELLKKTKSLEGDLNELRTLSVAASRNIDRLQQEVLEGKSLLDTRTAEKERLMAEIEKIVAQNVDSEQLQEVTKEINELDGVKAELTIQQNKAHQDEQMFADKVSAVAERKGRTETSLERIDEEIEALRESIKESYELDYQSASEYREADYNDVTGSAENKMLHKDLLALGPINANAETTLAVQQEEYDKTKIHYDDVVKAKDMLEETIKDLTNQMESIFRDSFEKIKVNFSEIFSLLFDGGHGKLDLDILPGQSVLDAGISIEAEPPGKKLANISLLSGGEKALTAICIIFAIIKLHPMPFCVLDEVDAPLDDSNATIYARFLKKYSRNTQFIIISHRKPTMELADELYGITMQEQGVSKHLSIKLSDALKMANKGGN